MDRQEPEKIRELLERERKFDPDLWIVELETGNAAALLAMAEEKKKSPF